MPGVPGLGKCTPFVVLKVYNLPIEPCWPFLMLLSFNLLYDVPYLDAMGAGSWKMYTICL